MTLINKNNEIFKTRLVLVSFLYKIHQLDVTLQKMNSLHNITKVINILCFSENHDAVTTVICSSDIRSSSLKLKQMHFLKERTSEILIGPNVLIFKGFSALKCSCFVLIFYETLLPVSVKNYS